MGLQLQDAMWLVAYCQGKLDAQMGWPLLSNPFALKVTRQAWTRGWLEQVNQR